MKEYIRHDRVEAFLDEEGKNYLVRLLPSERLPLPVILTDEDFAIIDKETFESQFVEAPIIPSMSIRDPLE